MSKKKQRVQLTIDPGKLIFTWEAHDYHPHERGWLWIIVFCAVIFGGAGWALWNGDWVMALTFFVVGAVYFFAHRKGEETHHISVFEKELQVDGKFFPWNTFSGYWFVFDERQAVSVINFQLRDKNDQKITLQMGYLVPDQLREVLEQVELPELVDKKEGLVDLWVRALKL